MIGLRLSVALPILWAIYLYNGGTPSCVVRGYDRFDWTVERPDEPFLMGESTGHSTIKHVILMPSGVTAFTAFKRITMLDDCAIVPDLVRRTSYVELQSPQLSAAVQAWRAGTNEASEFRPGTLYSHSNSTGPRDGSGNSANSTVIRKYETQHAPDWVEEQQLDEASFVAFWGSGHLFKGKSPDQYIWVGSN